MNSQFNVDFVKNFMISSSKFTNPQYKVYEISSNPPISERFSRLDPTAVIPDQVGQ